jgi:hypothetical protein
VNVQRCGALVMLALMLVSAPTLAQDEAPEWRLLEQALGPGGSPHIRRAVEQAVDVSLDVHHAVTGDSVSPRTRRLIVEAFDVFVQFELARSPRQKVQILVGAAIRNRDLIASLVRYAGEIEIDRLIHTLLGFRPRGEESSRAVQRESRTPPTAKSEPREVSRSPMQPATEPAPERYERLQRLLDVAAIQLEFDLEGLDRRVEQQRRRSRELATAIERLDLAIVVAEREERASRREADLTPAAGLADLRAHQTALQQLRDRRARLEAQRLGCLEELRVREKARLEAVARLPERVRRALGR